MSEPGASSIDAIIERIVATIDQGGKLDVQQLLDQHPSHAEALRNFFAVQDDMNLLPGIKPGQPKSADTPTHYQARTVSDSSAAPAQRFADYEILEEIARGGMGIVYRARQRSAGRIVALKLILLGRLASPDEVLRFRAEAEAAAQLDHPHIVSVYEVGEQDGQPYFSMKFIEGGSLAQALTKEHWPTRDANRLAARLVAQVAGAVHHAHERGILHRDLKPGNILLQSGRSGEVVPFVTDFGLAKRLHADAGLTQSGALVGTPSYMAPEQARGQKDLTVAVDVYSLGAILYELLTGKRPFQAETPMSTLLLVQRSDPAMPRSLNQWIDRDLEIICLKCLQKEPSSRYRSAEELAADLHRWLANEPILARPLTAWQRLEKWARRHPGVAALTATLMVTLLFGMATITWKWYEANAALRIAEEARREADRLALAEADAKENEAHQRRIAEMERDRATDALQRARISLGLQWVAQAERDREQGNLVAAEAQLSQVPEEYRKWEWHLVDGRCRPLFTGSRETHPRFSKDGTLVFTLASEGKEIVVREARTGRQVHQFKSARPLATIALSQDGRVGALSQTGYFEWDIETKERVRDEPVPGQTCFAVVSRDLRAFASAKGVLLYRGDKDKPQQLGNAPPSIAHLQFSRDGTRLVASNKNGEANLWNTAKGEPLESVKQLSTKRLAFDSKLELVACWEGKNKIAIRRFADGKIVNELESPGIDIPVLAFSSDDRYLLAGGTDHGVRIWEVESGAPVLHVVRHAGGVDALAMSPDNRLVATTHAGELKVWEVAPLPVARWKPCGHPITQIAFGPKKNLVAVAAAHQRLFLLEATKGTTEASWMTKHRQMIAFLAFTANQDFLVSHSPDDGELYWWDVKTQKEAGHRRGVSRVATRPDGSCVVADANGSLHLLNLQDGETTAIGEVEGKVKGLSFQQDGTILACCLEAGKPAQVRVLDVKAKRLLGKANVGGVCEFVRFSRDGAFVVWSDPSRKVLRKLTLGDGATLSEFPGVCGTLATCLSPNDSRFVSIGTNDRHARLWDTVVCQQAFALPLVRGFSAAFDPDGRSLALGDLEGTIHVWSTR